MPEARPRGGKTYAAISDVHANLEALLSVLKDIDDRKIEEVLFLGDAVGYGPNPNEALLILNKRCSVLLAGNHDRAAIGLADVEYFNPSAKAAILWTSSVLTEESRSIIGGFKTTEKKDDMLLVHSTPEEPEKWRYLLSYPDAERSFAHFGERICLIGHSHAPFIIERLPSGEMITHKKTAVFQAGGRYIVNAGSVGQPRDRDPRASYAIIDGKGAEIIRVEYPVEETRRKMREAGLPEPLIERLLYGI